MSSAPSRRLGPRAGEGRTVATIGSPDAEIVVAGAFLASPRTDTESLDRAQAILEPGMFTDHALGVVYAACARLRRQGVQPDVVTVSDALKNAGSFEDAGGYDRIATLVDAVPTAANVEYHARIVRDKALLRGFHQELERTMASVEAAELPLAELLHAHRDRVASLELSRGEALFTTSAASLHRYLDNDPPAREWAVPDVLPANVTALLAAMGGSGKGYLALMLLASLASGVPFLGLQVGRVGGVLYLAAEDDDEELHRRSRTVLRHYKDFARTHGLDFDLDAVADRMHVVSRVAADNLLTATSPDGEARRTPLVGRLIEAARQIPDLRAIVLDPASRFRGGQANHEEDATRFVEALEAIRQETGATVLCTAHVSQAGIRDGGGQEIVRGSTALVDGVRWVATLQRLRQDRAQDYGVHPEDAHLYLRLELPKNNYAPPFPGMWLRRETGGVLVPCDLQDRREARRDREAEVTYLDVLARLQRLLRDSGPMSKRQLRTYAGKSGMLGAGDHAVRAIAERAVREGALIERPGGILHPPAGDHE